MANTRNIQTFYGYSSRTVRNEAAHDAKGRAVSTLGAILAATRRVLTNEFGRCDIYNGNNGAHLYTVRRAPDGNIHVITR